MSTIIVGEKPAEQPAKPAECLLPNTRAMLKGTVETEAYRGKTLVRYRDLNGYTHRLLISDPDQAHEQFLKWVHELRLACQERRLPDVWGY
jgi:hypothetical protein